MTTITPHRKPTAFYLVAVALGITCFGLVSLARATFYDHGRQLAELCERAAPLPTHGFIAAWAALTAALGTVVFAQLGIASTVGPLVRSGQRRAATLRGLLLMTIATPVFVLLLLISVNHLIVAYSFSQPTGPGCFGWVEPVFGWFLPPQPAR